MAILSLVPVTLLNDIQLKQQLVDIDNLFTDAHMFWNSKNIGPDAIEAAIVTLPSIYAIDATDNSFFYNKISYVLTRLKEIHAELSMRDLLNESIYSDSMRINNLISRWPQYSQQLWQPTRAEIHESLKLHVVATEYPGISDQLCINYAANI